MKYIKLTFFASRTTAGLDLVDRLNQLFAQSIAGMQVELQTIIDGDQGDMMVAGLRDDIVIFDASVEDDIGANYRAAQMYPSCMEHFLVVSRTRLPLNFQPFHDGGTPDTFGETINRPLTLNNHQLIDWIRKKLESLEPQLPRPQHERLEVQKDSLVANFKNINQISEALISNSIKRRDESRKKTGRAFVSYLSVYSRHHRNSKKINGFDVEDLISFIQKQCHHNPDYPVLYYPPGTLSSEFMTEHRRWQVLSIIDWRIRATDEFWIFETDDYYDSWWTLAELASLSYIKHSYESEASKYRLPDIFICNPTKSEGLVPRKVKVDFIQNLSPELAREFGRRLSNSDPLTMGYETVVSTQLMRKLPIPVQWLMHKGIKLFMGVMASTSPVYQEMKEAAKKDPSMDSFNRYREMLNSDVFADSFWTDRIVTCPHCRDENQQKQNYDFQKFLLHQQTGQFRVSPEEMQSILNSGLWTCEVCGMQFSVIQEDYPQFIWWPVRVGKATGPGGVFVQKLPVFALQSLS